MKNPKVSVIMGVYNGGEILKSAVESILNQTFTDFEFIIIDDGSKDDSLLTLNSIDDSRLLIIQNQDNIGLTKSLNKALRLSRGLYIARQDADDLSHPDRLLKQVTFLDNHPENALVGCNALLINEHGEQIDTINLPSKNNIINTSLIKGNVFIHGSVIFRKNIVMNIGGYRENFRNTQDYDLWLRLLENHQLANLPEYLYTLRRLQTSISMQYFDHQLTFSFLSREFYKQRQLNQKDSYHRLDPENPERLLNQEFAYLTAKLAEEKFALCLNYAKESEIRNNFNLAYNWIKQARLLAPSFNSRNKAQKLLWSLRTKHLKTSYQRYIGWRFNTNL